MTSDPTEPDPRHLFVYGTLRSGGRAPASLRGLLRARGRKVGEGLVRGRLHDAGPYPAAVEPGDSGAASGDGVGGEAGEDAGAGERASSGNGGAAVREIRGVVYALEESEEVLRALDGYEGVEPGGGGLFRRDVVEVRLDDGRKLRAWIYWYNKDTDGLPEIPGGEWRPARGRGAPGPGA